MLIFGVSLCSAVEATGKFLTGGIGGQDKNWKRFNTFLSKYMAPEYQTCSLGTLTYGKVLWQSFRNGLAHGFAVCHGGFEGNRGEPYFVIRHILGRDSLMVNPYLMFSDYVTGLGRYLSELRRCQASDQLLKDFEKVFEDVFINGD